MMRYRTMLWATLGLLAATVLVGCAKESHVTFTINDDGSVDCALAYSMPRAMMEQQLKAMDRFEQGMDEEDEEGDAGKAAPAGGQAPPPADAKPAPADGAPAPAEAAVPPPAPDAEAAAKDAALAAKVRAMVEESGPQDELGDAQCAVKDVRVTADLVTVEMSIRFPDLGSFAAGSHKMFREIGVTQTLIDKDDAGNLRITLKTSGDRFDRAERKQARQMILVMQAKTTLTFVMPGRVVSSTLPTVEDRRASFQLDAAKPETLDAMEKLIDGDIVIVSEPGVLKLDGLPLDSLKLSQEEDGSSTGDLPVVDAVPGYRTEALGVTTTVWHVFPEGREFLQGHARSGDADTGGGQCRIQCRLFAPQTRRMMGIGKVRVTRAVDNLGRQIKLADQVPASDRYTQYYGYGEDRERAMKFDLSLPAPLRGAASLETVEGDVLVTSFASWKEHVIADPAADPAVEIDLGDLVPGAKLVVMKVVRPKGEDGERSRQVTVKLTGPKAVGDLRVKVRMEGMDDSQGQSYESSSSRRGGKTVTRMETIHYNAHGDEGIAPDAKCLLVIQAPTDMKRERVRFFLEGIDLF